MKVPTTYIDGANSSEIAKSELKEFWAPCQICMACRINHSTMWTTRLLNELQYHEHAAFVTLTYSDKHVPVFKTKERDYLTLRAYDMTLWFKKLRKHGYKFKYYYVGEYSEDNTQRPHYHAIIFGIPITDLKTLGFRLWGKCEPFCYTVELACQETIGYVCKYIHKTFRGNGKEDFYKFREWPKAYMSKGIGKKYALENKTEIVKKLFIETGVKKKMRPIPRYYRKLLGITWNMLPEKTEKDEAKFNEKHRTREQREKNLKAASKLKRRDFT